MPEGGGSPGCPRTGSVSTGNPLLPVALYFFQKSGRKFQSSPCRQLGRCTVNGEAADFLKLAVETHYLAYKVASTESGHLSCLAPTSLLQGQARKETTSSRHRIVLNKHACWVATSISPTQPTLGSRKPWVPRHPGLDARTVGRGEDPKEPPARSESHSWAAS